MSESKEQPDEMTLEAVARIIDKHAFDVKQSRVEYFSKDGDTPEEIEAICTRLEEGERHTITKAKNTAAQVLAYLGQPKRGMSDEEKLAKKIAEWVASPEGKASLEATAKEVEEMLAEMREKRKLDPELLRQPMTI